MDWKRLAKNILEGYEVSKEEALSILHTPDEDLLELLHGSYIIRHYYYGNKVKLNKIKNVKSGICPENCSYCSQSSISQAPVEKYTMLSKEEILAGAKQAYEMKVGTYCIVASGRGPSNREIENVTQAVREIKERYQLTVCACLGILKTEQAVKLKEAGVDRYNHNINTSERHHEAITTSHTYSDRVNTVELVKQVGISPCSGIIVGMKETSQDVVDMAFSLKTMDADSIPVNFLNAIPGTPLAGTNELNPRYCLKVLAMMRYVNPTKEIRISGGREVNLRSLQPLGLYPANSIFIGDYLTTEGQANSSDYQMLEDLGFTIDFSLVHS
ncbi:biotin synthase BioB [Bacillus andreraoultii]|uniref:biotin synthase BioB n=1 Tax=Bacillus andreraoultii TaxID=1499685 RepID=UPI00053B02F8